MLIKGEFKHYEVFLRFAVPVKVKLDYLGYDVKFYNDDGYYEALFFKDDVLVAAEYAIDDIKGYVEYLEKNKEKYKAELDV